MKTLKMLSLLVCLFASSAVSALEDPAIQTTVPCYYFTNLNWDYPGDGVPLVKGQVYFPSKACSFAAGPPEDSPVIIFTHGNAKTYKDYSYLMKHLALNGFVVATIGNGSHEAGSNDGRAKQAISYLNFLHHFWEHRDKLSNKVIFMGHSRGGEAAIAAAKLLYEQPDLAYENYNVKAVVSIAPTDGGGTHPNPTREVLTGDMTPNFLAIYGSHDDDVKGTFLYDPVPVAEKTAFAIYDRAEHESSKEGILTSLPMSKAMVFVHGANHFGFTDPYPGCIAPVSCTLHRQIAKGYINAFLQWKVFSDTEHRVYFDGTTMPKSLKGEGINLFHQFTDGKRRVVDNFSQNGITANTAGGSVTTGNGITQIAEDWLSKLDLSSPHQTKGAEITWKDSPNSSVRWNIPNDQIWGVGKRQNVSHFDYLSFRIGQVYNGTGNTEGLPLNFYIRLHTSSGLYVDVTVGDYATIPYPAIFEMLVPTGMGYVFGDFTKSAMQTVRIPLDVFKQSNLSEVKAIEFVFTHPRHKTGTIHVDNLEFTN